MESRVFSRLARTLQPLTRQILPAHHVLRRSAGSSVYSTSSTTPLKEDHSKIVKRTPEAVAYRASALQLVLSRWGLERTWDTWNEMAGSDTTTKEMGSNRITQGFDMLMSAVHSSKMYEHLTPREKQLMDLDLGSWCGNKEAEIEGRWESAGVICWALNLTGQNTAIPSYNVPFEREELFQSMGIQASQPATIRRFLEGRVHKLRTNEEIAMALRTAEAWYWRSRAQGVWELKRNLLDPVTDTSQLDLDVEAKKKAARKKIPKGLKNIASGIEGAIAQAAARCAEDGLIEKDMGGDFGVQVVGEDGKPGDWVRYSELDAAALDKVREIADNRCSALGWLTGNEWDFEGNLSFVNPVSSIWRPQEVEVMN